MKTEAKTRHQNSGEKSSGNILIEAQGFVKC